ncbi:MAG: nucleotidyl transferase AbiEii/AbiGii toxin family protein [Candidatus Omnitrophota bacterium]
MNNVIYTPLQMREVFHLEFLRWFSRKLKTDSYVLKGGVNLRFFFGSIRYSEDMDIDIQGVRVDAVKTAVLEILSARGFLEGLKSFGVERVVPPNMMKAKQTETTQRFKIHLLTFKGEDLFTKIDFSRRGMKGNAVVESVSAPILRSYKMAPLLVPHYDVLTATGQKIHALAQRSVLQARDIMDLFFLSSQCVRARGENPEVSKAVIEKAHENIFLVGFEQFRDTVVAYLGEEDRAAYSFSAAWDEIKLKTAQFLEELKNEKV